MAVIKADNCEVCGGMFDQAKMTTVRYKGKSQFVCWKCAQMIAKLEAHSEDLHDNEKKHARG
jgi:hypothetical protein